MTFCFIKYIFITLLGGRKLLKHDCLWVLILPVILNVFFLTYCFPAFHNKSATITLPKKFKKAEKTKYIPPDFRRILNAIT